MHIPRNRRWAPCSLSGGGWEKGPKATEEAPQVVPSIVSDVDTTAVTYVAQGTT
jgi:hypothetical protein